ncbi:unnamed protein product [Pseudo-nitzschia multistriata]|uniref:Uncharacterized protein n=1 Tax=Pseudo-nitzschia multistriata TaxID=183589 RepID=A0A448Z6H9_9STRA|nr:unnamed protein product [Pseudo-nitzschia multistriata]
MRIGGNAVAFRTFRSAAGIRTGTADALASAAASRAPFCKTIDRAVAILSNPSPRRAWTQQSSTTTPTCTTSRSRRWFRVGGSGIQHQHQHLRGVDSVWAKRAAAAAAIAASGVACVCLGTRERHGLPASNGHHRNRRGTTPLVAIPAASDQESRTLDPPEPGAPVRAYIATSTSPAAPRRRDTLRVQLGGSSVVLVDHHSSGEGTTSRPVAHDASVPLVLPEDEATISPFLYCLMSQAKLVRIREEDQERTHLPIGLPGFACAHCCKGCSGDSQSHSRKRWSRIFPTDRRTLPSRVRKQLYRHIQRCERCPLEVKLELRRLKKMEDESTTWKGKHNKISREERLFFKKLWFRMGHKEEL